MRWSKICAAVPAWCWPGRGRQAGIFSDPLDADPAGGGRLPEPGTIAELTRDLRSGAARVLLILGGNPAFTAPADLDFADALLTFSRREDRVSARLGLY